MFETKALLSLLGHSNDDPLIEQFLIEHRIHDRPKTKQQLVDEEAVEDDDETDVEYELERAAQDSLVVQSERLGLCLIFKPQQDFVLVNAAVPGSASPFVLEEVALFAKGVQIYQQYGGALPGGVTFSTRRSDVAYTNLGAPLARRDIHETSTDLFLVNDRIVNMGFAEGNNTTIAVIHVRNQNDFDRKMLAPKFSDTQQTSLVHVLGAQQIGEAVQSPQVRALFETLAIDEDDMYDGVCPEEITRLTQSHGITLYFRTPLVQSDAKASDTKRGQQLSTIAFKRRGDLGSLGFHDPLPFGFEFGDAPQTQTRKAGRPPDREHQSDQLRSYFWKTDSGIIVQAVSSLIDWQLCRVSLHAAFLAPELVLAS
jgi:hypothetical protein